MQYFSINQATVGAAVTWIIGQLVAFVPSLGAHKQDLISLGTTLVVLGFLIANAIHAHAAAKKPAAAPAVGNSNSTV